MATSAMIVVNFMALVLWVFADCSSRNNFRGFPKDGVLLQLRKTDVHMVMPWSPGCMIGSGFDFEHGCTYPQAMEHIPSCDGASSARGIACVQDRMADKVTSYTRDVRSSSDYSRLLDVTTKAEAGGFGISVSTSVGVLTKSAWSTSSMSFVLGASGEVKTSSVDNPVALRLNEAAAEKLRVDPVGFLDRYSPYYVHSIVHGGSFLGAVTLNSKKTSSTDGISFALGFSVNLGLFSLGGSSEFTNKVEENHENVEMTLNADWKGGTGVHLAADATTETLAETYDAWSKSWRNNPHELKIALRRWIDIEEIQSIVNTHSPEVQRLFNADTLKPTIQAMLARENADMSLLQNSLDRARDWKEMQRNRTLQDDLYALNFQAQRHRLALEQLDHIGVMQRQNEVLQGDDSWFAAKRLMRLFEDMRFSLGRHCDDGSRIVNGYCEPWSGKCENGYPLPLWKRKGDDECGSCHPGYVLLDRTCSTFILHDKIVTEERHDGHRYDGHKSAYIADSSEGFICALQQAGVEDLGTDLWSTASCKIYPEFGRIKMDAVASGQYTDAVCGSRCLETNYPVTQHHYVKRNEERESGVTGFSSKTMISTTGSVCWLSMVSFWQATHRGDWAECSIKANVEKMWEVRASLKQTKSKTGAECGAVCMHELPEESFKIEDEVIKHSDHSDCEETDLGSSENRTCFLSSMAVSHAYDWKERPRCDLEEVEETQGGCCAKCGGSSFCSPRSGNCYETKKDYYETCAMTPGTSKKRWVLKTCNGKRREAETMCGARCVKFITS